MQFIPDPNSQGANHPHQPKRTASSVKLSCLKFPSLAALERFTGTAFPCIVEELGTVVCGLFTESHIELARKEFRAVWWEKQSKTWV